MEAEDEKSITSQIGNVEILSMTAPESPVCASHIGGIKNDQIALSEMYAIVRENSNWTQGSNVSPRLVGFTWKTRW